MWSSSYGFNRTTIYRSAVQRGGNAGCGTESAARQAGDGSAAEFSRIHHIRRSRCFAGSMVAIRVSMARTSDWRSYALSAMTSVPTYSLNPEPGGNRHIIKPKCRTWLYQSH